MEKAKSILSNNRYFIYTILFLFSLFLASCCQDYDYDLYARFIVGENFFEKGVFNYQDFLSYTPTHNWYDHEYGASLVYYLFFKWFGNFGLILIQGILTFFTAFFVIKIQKLQRHSYPVSIFFIGLFLVLFAHHHPSLIRCHMFSFMFFAMFLYILEKTRIGYLHGKPSKILWLVPPLIILWNNIHGGVVSGLGIIAIYLLGTFITKQNWQIYLKVLVISVPLLIINPYGVEYVDFLISANTKQRSMITEWWNVFVLKNVVYYYPMFCIGIFGVFLVIGKYLNKKKLNITNFLVLAVTVTLGTMHIKLLALPLISVFAFYSNDIIKLLNKKIFKFLELIGLLTMIICICLIPTKELNTARTSIVKFPVKEVEFIKINNIKGNLLTEFGLGSYVSYKLYPYNLIYMDGRYEEVYYDKEFDNLMRFENVDKNNWTTVLKNYPTEIILLYKNTPVYAMLESLKDWVKIYEGNVFGIFIQKSKAKKNYQLPSDDIEYYRKNEFVNNGFFGKENKVK